jgi:hypothetical protein
VADGRALPMPSSYPPDSYVRARRSPPSRDEQVQRILTRAYERPLDSWSVALALVEPVAPLREVDSSEPEQAPKRSRDRENHATQPRGLRAKRGRHG